MVPTRSSHPHSRIYLSGAIGIALVLALLVILAPVTSAKGVSTYPVTLSVSPKSASYGVGGTPGVTVTAKNTGSQTFVVTACIGEFRGPGSSTYHKFDCPNFSKFSLPAGKSAKNTYSIYPYHVTSSTPKGTYDLKGYYEGTVGSTTYDSDTVSFTITIT